MSFRLIHLGGEHTVTGPCHLLQANGLNIMVDCGLAQSNDVILFMESWPVAPSEVDYLFLTHAHIDLLAGCRNGEKFNIEAKVHTLSGYSAHADQKGLIEWVASMPVKPGRIKLVHGEVGALMELYRELGKRIKGFNNKRGSDQAKWRIQYNTNTVRHTFCFVW